MSAKRAVESAEGVALLRALGCKEVEDDFRNPDYLARSFLGLKYKIYYFLFGLALERGKASLEKRAPGSYWYLFARTVHMDTILIKAIKQGIDQLVIMGAGYDTRCLRYQQQLKGVRCFEVDLPQTQQRKKQHLRWAIGDLPPNLTMVPIDFTTQNLEDVLYQAGYIPGKRTLFIWEGVCMYLPEAAVDEVFSFVRSNTALGTSIVFDCIVEDVVNGRDVSGYGCKAMRDNAIDLGEEMLYGMNPHDIRYIMENRGFKLVSDYSPRALTETYLRRDDGSVVGPILEAGHFVHAEVRG